MSHSLLSQISISVSDIDANYHVISSIWKKVTLLDLVEMAQTICMIGVFVMILEIYTLIEILIHILICLPVLYAMLYLLAKIIGE